MTITCPRCGTRYRQPRATRGDAGTTYRCKRCRHVFAAGRPRSDDDEDGDTEPAPSDDEPNFVFADEPVQDLEEEPARRPPPTRPRARAEEPAAPSRGTSPFQFAFRSFWALTIGFGILSVYFYTYPEAMRGMLGRIPMLGATLAETRINPASIQLANVRGTYERVKGDRLVFVVAGSAINQSSMPVKGIQIGGRIVGAQEQQQVVFCGAAPHDLQDLSLREITMLQTLEPPKEWALGPGEQADFLVVFVGPPPDLREFAAEVIAVQSAGHRRNTASAPDVVPPGHAS